MLFLSSFIHIVLVYDTESQCTYILQFMHQFKTGQYVEVKHREYYFNFKDKRTINQRKRHNLKLDTALASML